MQRTAQRAEKHARFYARENMHPAPCARKHVTGYKPGKQARGAKRNDKRGKHATVAKRVRDV